MADNLVDDGKRAVGFDVVNTEGTAQDMVAVAVDPDMDELSGPGGGADFRHMESDQEIVILQPFVADDFACFHTVFCY